MYYQTLLFIHINFFNMQFDRSACYFFACNKIDPRSEVTRPQHYAFVQLQRRMQIELRTFRINIPGWHSTPHTERLSLKGCTSEAGHPPPTTLHFQYSSTSNASFSAMRKRHTCYSPMAIGMLMASTVRHAEF